MSNVSPPNITPSSETVGFNPLAVGLGHFPAQMNEEAWLKLALAELEKEGPEQYLVNLLHVLRQKLAPEGGLNEMEGFIHCTHDGFPMIMIDDEFICTAEYIFAHLENSPVVDLISTPNLTLIFQNGHTMPLYCAECGESMHINDEDRFLNTLNGLCIVDADWDYDNHVLLLEFGRPFEPDNETIPLEALEVHLDSVRHIQCPEPHDVD